MLVAVVIPVYNERATLPVLIERLNATPPPVGPGGPCDRVIVLVDDGSTDGTAELVRSMGATPGVVALHHATNKGKGAALRSGFRAALSAGADILLVQDGDLEYDPSDHSPLVAPILDGRADVVIGSRFLGRTHRVLYYWHWVANQAITQLSNMLTNLNLSDIECCLKAFTRAAAEGIDIREDRFGVEPELVAKVARLRLPGDGTPRRAGPARVYETPVSYSGRTYAEGKKIGWRDGLSALRCILKYNLL